MMNKELMTQLRRLSIERRDTACLGCGFENNCGVRGCQAIRRAMEMLPVWHDVRDGVPADEEYRLVACRDKKGRYSINRAYFLCGTWHGSGSTAGVTHFMDLPDAPEVEENDS